MKAKGTSYAILVIILGLFLDQWTKYEVFQAAVNGEIPFTVTSFFDVVIAWNTGISFSFLSSSQPMMHLALAGFALLVSLILLMWLFKERSFLTKMGFALVIAGAMGNAIDRIRFGAVLDFLHFHYQEWSFPAFNVADTLINVGVGFIIIQILFFNAKALKK